MRRHEIPTHLDVADRAFAGLTVRQLLTLAAGLALAHGLASDLPLPLPARLVAGAVVLLLAAMFALWRPAGRPAEQWAFVLLRYLAAARVATWRPRERRVAPRREREVVLTAPPRVRHAQRSPLARGRRVRDARHA